MLTAYRKYKEDANGWGVPDFKEFRRVLHPLRKKTEWNQAESEFVSDLVEQGGGYALQRFFGRHPVAAALVGTGATREPASPVELAASIRPMIRACKKAGWGRDRFQEYVEFLDSGLSVRDLRSSATVKADDHPSVDCSDGFVGVYRSSGEWVKRFVRDMFAEASGG